MKESKLSRALTWMIDIIFSGLLWCLFSLPLVTIGAASSALYYAAVKCIRHDRGRLSRVFLDGFRKNFKSATRMWLLYLAAGAVGAANVFAAFQWGGTLLSPLTALGGVVFLPLLLTLPWMFAYISRFENSLKGSLVFVGYLAAHHPGKSLLLALELLGTLLIRGGVRHLKRIMDPEIYGGAPLLGVNGNVIITHGASTHKAIYHAIRVSAECVRQQVAQKISERLAELDRRRAEDAASAAGAASPDAPSPARS